MPKLYRPPIPLETRYRVVLRQLGELWIGHEVAQAKKERRLKRSLEVKLCDLAVLVDSEDLDLDHDPPLAARQRTGEGRNTIYIPAANDPEFLVYRPRAAHKIKTNVRGDGAQYPDRVLIKRERERRKVEDQNAKMMAEGGRAWPTGSFAKSKRKWPKRQWPKRKMR